jgi:S-adenosylmethionine:tRNA ribosyltransferase-isomerase
VYGASKAALDHLTRIAAAELGGSGVRFFSVDPGEMDTQMHADAMPEADPKSLQSPGAVAEQIVLMIEQADRIENGARLIASNWPEAGKEAFMKAASAPRTDRKKVKLLVVEAGEMQDGLMERLPDHLRPGDLLVVNDAATLPASLHGRDENDHPVEIRLAAQLSDRSWQAVIFGAGDWRTPTEHRPAPPHIKTGEEIAFAEDFSAIVLRESKLSGRLLDLEFNRAGEDLWRGIYRYGKPVQYSYMTGRTQPSGRCKTFTAAVPWAVEMPSAGHALDWQLLLKLREKGIQIATLTHGAGLSATGDAKIDQALPLAEKFEIPAATMEAVKLTRVQWWPRHRHRHFRCPRSGKCARQSERLYHTEDRP